MREDSIFYLGEEIHDVDPFHKDLSTFSFILYRFTVNAG